MSTDNTLLPSSPTKSSPTRTAGGSFKCPVRVSTPIKTSQNRISKTINGLVDKPSNRSLSLQYNELRRQIREKEKENDQMRDAIRILNKYDKDLQIEELIVKWRCVCQGSLSFLFNETLFKVDKLGGYEEFIRKEVDAEKARLEYQMDNSMEEEFSTLVESDEFQSLPPDDQEEYRARMEEQRHEAEILMEKSLKQLDKKISEASGKEMTLEELTKRLNVSYELVYRREE